METSQLRLSMDGYSQLISDLIILSKNVHFILRHMQVGLCFRDELRDKISQNCENLKG